MANIRASLTDIGSTKVDITITATLGEWEQFQKGLQLLYDSGNNVEGVQVRTGFIWIVITTIGRMLTQSKQKYMEEVTTL